MTDAENASLENDEANSMAGETTASEEDLEKSHCQPTTFRPILSLSSPVIWSVISQSCVFHGVVVSGVTAWFNQTTGGTVAETSDK